ncbi:MAG TPA: hypothetical protein VFD38_18505 [Myxococcaceae bacterium]|nr:hypothetical protein [Myxococcaceae bacterium]
MRLSAPLRLALTLLPISSLAAPATPQDVATLFTQWREFQRPPRAAGVPDYSAKAMAAQARAVPGWLKRVDALDVAGAPVPLRNDVRLIRAEMNGLDFNHRVLSPWTRDPAFYVTIFDEQSDQPAREAEYADAAVELWALKFPLSADAERELLDGLRVVPPLLAQARRNLTGNGKDLWRMAGGPIQQQSAALTALAPRVASNPALSAAVKSALAATEDYHRWVEQRATTKTGPSGVGVANYDWYLANVALIPYTHAQLVTLMERELGRARGTLAAEELRNRALPPQLPATTVQEHQGRFDDALKNWIRFLRENDFITWEDWMEPALAVLPGGFDPRPPLEFFSEVEARDPLPLRLHMWHFMDLAVLARRPPADPVRQRPALYNIFATRTEGFTTALEELMMHAGLFEGRPRSRELVYVMLGQRAARALGDLHMHDNTWTLEQASEFTSRATPRGWLRLDGRTVRGEQHLWLRRPSYGTTYIVGKQMTDELITAMSRNGPLPMKALLDGINRTGLLPMLLVVQELSAGP